MHKRWLELLVTALALIWATAVALEASAGETSAETEKPVPASEQGPAVSEESSAASKAGSRYLDVRQKPWLLGTSKEPWQFTVAMYLWLPNAPAKIDLGPIGEDLPENLDTILDSLQFGMMLDFEVRKGRFGGYFSPIFIWLRDDDTRVQGPIQEHKVIISESVFIADFGLSYEVGRWRLWDRPTWILPRPAVVVEPFFGGRTLADGLTIELKPPGRKTKPDIEFVAPVVGLRTFWGLTDRAHLRFEGDYGGWGVDGLDETWNFLGLAAWRFAPKKNLDVEVFAGYRYLNIVYKDVAAIDIDVKGPLLGVGLKFGAG